MITLLSNQGAAGNGPVVPLQPNPSLRRAEYSLYVWGTFSGATVTLQASPDGENFVPVPNISITAPGEQPLDLQAVAVQAVVTGGTITGGVNVALL